MNHHLISRTFKPTARTGFRLLRRTALRLLILRVVFGLVKAPQPMECVMTRVTKFSPDQTFKDRLKSHGFCLDDPDRRHPTRNEFPLKVLKLSRRADKDRAALLLAGRDGQKGLTRTRVLPWLAPILGWAGWPDRAWAHDHHPTSAPPYELPPVEFTTVLDGMQAWLNRLDPTDPVWTLALLGSLLMTQTVAVFQRRALLKASAAPMPPTQPDLFPETMSEVESEPVLPRRRWQWRTDAATRQGQVRDENQDAVHVLRLRDDLAVLIVCDGAGGVGGGQEASQSAVTTMSDKLQAIWDDTGAVAPDDLETAIATARQVATDKDLKGVTTALLVLLDGETMHYATLGDGAIAVIWPDGMVGPVQVPHHTLGRPSNEIGAYIGSGCESPARAGTLRLEPGCFVLAMTDGVSDLFTFEDVACARHKLKVEDGLADSVIAQLEAARDPDSGAWLHSDNMTLAIAQLVLGGSDDTAD